ncbi:YciI family protein [candidate division KSB1 bacterium]|nr:YciI family protein [candidate division KSB1 bacterium]
MHYLLFYEVTPDYAERRKEFRNEHLKLAWEAHEAGELILGGALADSLDGAILLFQGESPEIAERFAKSDPYIKNGLVKKWWVRKWTTVVGEMASAPVKPDF